MNIFYIILLFIFAIPTSSIVLPQDFKEVMDNTVIHDTGTTTSEDVAVIKSDSDIKGSHFNLVENLNAAEILNSPEYDDVTSYFFAYYTEGKSDTLMKAALLESELNVVPEPEPLKFLFFGDTMLDRYVKTIIERNRVDYIFSDLKAVNFFDNRDLISANLEGAVTNGGEHYKPIHSNDFAFSPEVIDSIKDYGFNFFSISNNHLSDQGDIGIKETETNLSALGINYSGCRDGLVDECSVRIVEINGKKIGMLGLSMVYSKLDLDKLSDTVNNLAKETDLIFANVHWGIEYVHQFNQQQQIFAHKLIDLGVDIIVGHHPHVVQGMEMYKNKPIFFSLGNFVFDQYFSQATQTGLALGMELKDDNLSILFHPFKSNITKPILLTDDDKSNFLAQYIQWSTLNPEQIDQVKDGGIKL